MALPVQPNTTLDIYRNANDPPAAPDVAGVSGLLRPAYHAGSEASERTGGTAWTHVLLVDSSIDIRDGYVNGTPLAGAFDKVYVPDRNGTPFRVIFVELIRLKLAEHKRVYLQRAALSWPTEHL